jgi:hypothetical protein
MLGKWKLVLAAAAFCSVAGSSGVVEATPKPLEGTVNGTLVSSGWTWDVSSATAPLVNLVFIRVEGNNFFFEKDAEIKRTSDPLVITFNRIDPNAKTLIINDEAVVNNSGEDWTAFRMELSSGSSAGGVPNFAFMTSDGTPGIGDFKIDPFTQFTFYNQNSGLLLNGGTVKVGSTWQPGSQSNTGLAIVANALTDNTFSLKELAIPGTAIPLPAAAWTGLSTLVGLGILGAGKKLRSRLI